MNVIQYPEKQNKNKKQKNKTQTHFDTFYHKE